MKTITEIISNLAVSLTPSIDSIAKDSAVVTYVRVIEGSPLPNPLITIGLGAVISILALLLSCKIRWVDDHFGRIIIPVVGIAALHVLIWSYTYKDEANFDVQPIQEQIAEQGITMSDKELENRIKRSEERMRTEIVEYDGEIANFNIISKKNGTYEKGEYLVTWSITEVTPGQ